MHILARLWNMLQIFPKPCFAAFLEDMKVSGIATNNSSLKELKNVLSACSDDCSESDCGL